MAGNKVNAKTKGKEDKGKNKSVNSTNDDTEDVDFAMLRKPIPTRITGFAQARKIFDLATEELKDLLTNECDLLYECKVCRNIFRSLANFISHKRVYCKEKFSSSVHSEFFKATTAASELSKIKRIERGYQEFLKSKNRLGPTKEQDAEDNRIPITKDLTEMIEKLTKTKGIQNSDVSSQVLLQRIPNSSVAVFQNLKNDDKQSDKMRAQVRELDHILSRDQAVLQSDGKFTIVSSTDAQDTTASDNVIQISDDDETDEQSLTCKICNMQFSTQKTLKYHMKYKHVETRLVYPCPDCVEIFSTSWSVYRHLFKVHRKTAAQIRRLRESIQSKAFKMNNPPAFYERRKNTMKMAMPQKLTEEERIDQENQAWMDNIEGDGEAPRCGGCGRTFERRAALAAHTQTCQPRNRALARRPDAKKIEIQIRKDYNKGPSGITIMKPTGIQEKPADEENSQRAKTNSKIETAESNGNAEANQSMETNENTAQNDMDYGDDDDKEEDTAIDVGEDDAKSNDSNELPDLAPDPEDNFDIDIKAAINLPYSIQAEKSNLAAFKQRINPHVDFNSLACKRCNAKQKSGLELFIHMASHFKWKRYACKLCNFKHYEFNKLPEHVKVVHKLRGDTDFYCSTVKAIDGTEAMILSRCLVEEGATEEVKDQIETSPESRRPSRCPSSDSSRMSDDSTSSSNVKETGSRKRKRHHTKSLVKKKKDVNDEDIEKNGDMTTDKVNKVILGDSNSSMKFEDNSSDMDDAEEKEKVTKRGSHENASTASTVLRRPVRKKTKPKNEDFEYDLSNLLKMEAQGYRDSQQVLPTKSYPIKKKTTPDPQPTQTDTSKQSDSGKLLENSKQLDNIKHNCFGALAALSRKAVQKSAAQMKTSSFATYTIPKERSSNVFARPMIPKGNKISPRKDTSPMSEDIKESIQNKNPKGTELTSNVAKDSIGVNVGEKKTDDRNEQTPVKDEVKRAGDAKTGVISSQTSLICNEVVEKNYQSDVLPSGESTIDNSKIGKAMNLNIPAVIPMKIRRQSLEMMKPIINKKISDLSKAGMKTKILVIKPIKKDKDGSRSQSSSQKFQAIKLKDPNRGLSNDDQAILVKVPKVTCTSVSELATQTNTSSVMSITKIIEPEIKKAEEIPATLTVLDSSQNNESQCSEDEIVENETNVINTEDTNTISTMNEEIVNTESDSLETVQADATVDK